jgi:hypothetical protein
VFHLEYTSGLKLDCPYSALGIRGRVAAAGVDPESGDHAFYFERHPGKAVFVPYDEPLRIAGEPEYAKHQAIFQMTKRLNDFIGRQGVAKRELARRMGTSLSQLARLLDTTNYKKEMARLIELARILDYEFHFEFKKVG